MALTSAAADTDLSTAEIETLLFNIEEEKLAGDVYEVLSDLYDLQIFDRIAASELDELVVTDTIPLTEAAKACGRIRQLSVAELLAETIRRVAFGESVSSLYVD